jgi:hypothetical protein
MEKTISEKSKDSDPPFLAPPANRDLTARKHWGQAALKNIMPDLRFIYIVSLPISPIS